MLTPGPVSFLKKFRGNVELSPVAIENVAFSPTFSLEDVHDSFFGSKLASVFGADNYYYERTSKIFWQTFHFFLLVKS